MAAAKSKKPGKPSGQLRRHLREKARREKLLRQKPPGVKEQFVSGCFALGIVAVLVFISAIVYSCFTAE